MPLWVSLLGAQALPGSKDVGECAYVNGLAVAESVKDAEAAFELSLWNLGWKLISAEDTEEFAARCAQYEVDEELKKLAPIACETGEPQFGTFHTWDEIPTVN